MRLKYRNLSHRLNMIGTLHFENSYMLSLRSYVLKFPINA